MKRISIIGGLSICLVFGGLNGVTTSFASQLRTVEVVLSPDGGGDEKEKGGKKGKGEEKDEEKKQAKMETSAKKNARLSAQTTRKNMRWKHKEIMTRAKTRNYFHKAFNTKHGRFVNFRSSFTRKRWRKGRI